MKRLLGLVLATGMVLGTAMMAEATVVTFDDLPGSAFIPNGYAGLDWSNLRIKNTIGSGPSGYVNGLVSPFNVVYNSGGTPGSVSSATAFDFVGAYLTAAWNTGLNINLQGWNGATLLYNQTVVVDPWAPTYFNLNFNGITSLYINSFGGVDVPQFNGSGTHIAMDNFTYNQAAPHPTPEPSTMILLGSGVLGLVAARRLKRS